MKENGGPARGAPDGPAAPAQTPPSGDPRRQSPRDSGAPHRTGDSRHRATPWPQARAIAERAGRAAVRAARRDPVHAPLDAALGLTLAAPLTALTDLPSFDTSAMDGWAVSGPAPGRCVTRARWRATPSPIP